MTNQKTCKEKGCTRPYYARGWCQGHYAREWSRGLPPLKKDLRRRLKRRCSVRGCERQAKTRGWCHTHYERWRRNGTVELRSRRTNPIIRFNRFLEKTSGCWWWIGRDDSRGYGLFFDGEKQVRAHLFSYRFFKGEIPKGHHVHHTCLNRGCVNPKHLVVVSPKNHKEIHAALKTHCPRGHPYDAANTYRSPRGERRCRECHRQESRQRARRKILRSK